MRQLRRYWPGLSYLVLVGLIQLPVLVRPGFLFLLDTVWAPHLNAHLSLSSGMPIAFVLKTLTYVLPSDLVQKLYIGLILWLAGYLMYRFARTFVPRRWASAAGVIYLINPFVYERLVAGQWAVLAGYALLPLIVDLFWRWLSGPTLWGWLRFAAAFALYPLVSLHFAYMAGLFLALFSLGYLILDRSQLGELSWRAVRWGFVLPFGLLVVNSFWFLNHGSTSSSALQHLRISDLQAFKTAADPHWGVWVNVANLYGFWFSEYFLPKDFFSLWWIVGILFLASTYIGLWKAVKEKHWQLVALRFWMILAFWLAVGLSSPLTRPLTDFLVRHLPGYIGLRDTGKWIGWIAFSYATLVPLAGYTFEKWLTKRWKLEWRILAPGGLILVVLLNSGAIFWGAAGQLVPAQYPSGWAAAKSQLTVHSKALALPWHEYVKLNFAGNHYVSNPAHAYFGNNVVVGSRTDNVFLDERPKTDTDVEVNRLLAAQVNPNQFVSWLKGRGYTGILLEQTDDADAYQPLLDKTSTLKQVLKGRGVTLYSIR